MIPVGGHRPHQTTITNTRLKEFLAAAPGKSYYQLRECPTLPADATCYVQWGWKQTCGSDAAMRRGLPVIILDGSYFRDYDYHNLDCISVSVNGFHGNGLLLPTGKLEKLPPRYVPKPKTTPDTSQDAVIWVYGQLPRDRATMNADVEAWASRAAREATELYQRPAVIRPHPKMINPWEPQLPPLWRSFETSMLSVTWTSTCAVTSVVEGIPTVAMHSASPVSRWVPNRLDKGLARIDRDACLHDLSWRQFRADKLEEAWAYLEKLWPMAITQAAERRYNTEGLRI